MLKLALVGQGISYSRSPQLHHDFGKQTGISVHYELHDIARSEFETHIQSLIQQGYHGCNITQPFKVRAFQRADHVTDAAKRTGASNTLRFGPEGIVAHNTDEPGFLAECQRLNLPISSSRCLILGAGGSAQTVVSALATLGASEIWMANRSLDAIQNMQSRYPHILIHHLHSKNHPLEHTNTIQHAPSPLIMIDCTSLRDHEHPALADLSCEPTRTWVYDLKYPKPLPTVNWAYRREISQVHTGEGLLIQQAALAFEFWSGKLPDIAHFIHRD